MKTRLLGGIAALLVAIVGTVLLVTYVQNADNRALAGTETETVYVVQKAIPAGTAADKIAGWVTKKEVPKLALADNSVTDLGSLGSKVTAVALMPGEQLLSSRMVEQNAFLGPSRVQVPSGLQELTLKLPIERVAGGKLMAGDTVGVFLSLEQASAAGADGQAGTKTSKTQLSFHKVLVTAAQFSDGAAAQTGSSSESKSDSGTSQASSTSSSKAQSDGTYLITLARNSADAERIVFAAEFGKIYLSKEPGDAVETSAGFVDTARLFR